MNKKIFLPALLSIIFASAFGIGELKAGDDSFPDIDWFQCSRHGGDTGCSSNGQIWLRGSDYTSAAISGQFLGHRHGGSYISSNICVYLESTGAECVSFSGSGSQLGEEYGGEHPWDYLGGGQASVSGNPGRAAVWFF